MLAPGVTDSASSLSYTYTNELVNSFIKDVFYARAGDEDYESFSVLGRHGVFGVGIDFRKRLHISTRMRSGSGSFSLQSRLWGCRCRYRSYVGTNIFWITLADFDVDKFKTVGASPCTFPPTDHPFRRWSRSAKMLALSNDTTPT